MHRIAIQRGRVARTCALAALITTSAAAHAVIVRGIVRDPLGRPVASARVQLVKGTQVVASTVTNPDGSYEIRSTEEGRFLLLTSAATFSLSVGEPFYGGQLDWFTQNPQLTLSPVRQEITVTATGLPTPVQQTSSSVAIIPQADLATRVDLTSELRLQPGVSVVTTGEYGALTSLFVRGANSDANKILIDGVPANDVGGTFDFGTVSSTAVATVETHRGPDSTLYGTDARAAVLRFDTPRGTTIRPVLTYSGDAGNLHTWRNEATLSGAHSKVDYYTAFSRFDSSNTLPNDRFHASTAAANLGFNLTANTSLRGTVRNAVSATGLPGPYNFQGGVTAIGKQSDQDTYISGALDDTRPLSGWHNALRYLAARKREQSQQLAASGTPDGFGDFYGPTTTIHGANNTSATGSAYITYFTAPTRYDLANNRDGVEFQSDRRFNDHLSILGGFRFQAERGLYRYPLYATNQTVDRQNYDYTLALQGSFYHRLFYTLGGAVQRNSLYGTRGEPQLGASYYILRPRAGWFHGTRVTANFSKGVQEPNLTSQLSALYTVLTNVGDTADRNALRVTPITAQLSRTYEGGADQNIYGDKAVFHARYFHSVYDRGLEYVDVNTFNLYFHQSLAPNLYGFYLNSLATRSQGVEASVEYQIRQRLFVHAGYTYLDSTVLKSLSSDAVNALLGTPILNPKYPNTPIGISSPLVGQRPFRRAPQTGYAVLQYNGDKFNAALKAAFSSRSDDSTFLGPSSNAVGDNSLLLPNRNLNYGFTRLDLNLSYQLRPSVAVFTQLENLLNNQHIAAFGYPSLPLTVRAGLKIRFPSAQ